MPQIQKRNHGLLIRAEKLNLHLFRAIIIHKGGFSNKIVGMYRRERHAKDKSELACGHLRSMSDDDEILARYWAMDLRKLKPDQQIYAKKVIDILFESTGKSTHTHSQSTNHLHVPCLLLHHTQISHYHMQVIIHHIQAILL